MSDSSLVNHQMRMITDSGASNTTPLSPIAGPSSWARSRAEASMACSTGGYTFTRNLSFDQSIELSRKRPLEEDSYSQKIGQLVEMGLQVDIAQKALYLTNNASIEVALNWALDYSSEDLNSSLGNFNPPPLKVANLAKDKVIDNDKKKPPLVKDKVKQIPTITKRISSLSSAESTTTGDNDSTETETSDDEDCFAYGGCLDKKVAIAPMKNQPVEIESVRNDPLRVKLVLPTPVPAAPCASVAREEVFIDYSDEEEEDKMVVDVRVAIIINNSLNLSVGGVSKQVVHAFSGLSRNLDKDDLYQLPPWQDAGEMLIIARGNSTLHLQSLRRLAYENQLPSYLVDHPAKTQQPNGEATALAIIGDAEVMDQFIGKLTLL